MIVLADDDSYLVVGPVTVDLRAGTATGHGRSL
jgi:hypothetical protein